MKSLYLFLFGVLFSVGLSAQEESSKNRSTEVGMNITNTLAGFFNSGGSNLPVDPYLFSLKLKSGVGYLRFGVNFSVKNQTEFPGNSTVRLKENDVFFRGGYEWRSKIDSRFTLYYGLDAVLEYQNEQLDSENFGFENLSSSENVYGYGGGPVLGIQFMLSKRVSLATEGSIYGVVQHRNSQTELGNGLPPQEKQSTDFRLAPSVPSSLYVIFVF